MDFRNLILDQPFLKDKLVKIVGIDDNKVRQIFDLFFEDTENSRINQRSSCVAEVIAKKHPQLITPYLPKLVNILSSDIHYRYIRNSLRILQYIEIPKTLQGKTANICFDILSNRNTPVAIQAFSMTVLLNICKKEPELKNELQLVIEDQFEYSKPAFKSRGRKTLQELAKL